MKVATPQQMREMDSLAVEEYGIPGIVLMENAALCVVNEIEKLLGGCRGKTAAVFAGKGNNGGDAYAAARHLHNRGAKVQVYSLFEAANPGCDAEINHEIIRKLEIPEINIGRESFPESACCADVIVDGIFGTGFKGQVEGIAKEAIEIINASGKPVISIDIPSGVDGARGIIGGSCIKADVTVTFGLAKLGLVVHPGCEHCGRLVIADIGIPEGAVRKPAITKYLIDQELVKSMIPKRKTDSSKGDYGKLLIVTGSTGMTGAGCLTARAALRTGAGLVYMAVPASLTAMYNNAVLEAVKIPVDDGGKGAISEAGAEILPSLLEGRDAAAIGPGLSTAGGTAQAVFELLSSSEIPLVLDADALNLVARDAEALKKAVCPVIITPHPGEMARLTGKTIAEVQSDRLGTALEFSRSYNVITVLKGAGTIVALPDGTVYINPTGNPGMSTGGSGDVLTGIITALIGQGVGPSQAAVAGVYIHGLAGDAAAGDKGQHGLIASDIIEKIPYIIKELVKREE